MSLSIYTYSNPYEISNEPYWDSIKNCAHFCVSQTMVNGLSEVYDELKNGQLTTVEELVKALYPGWFDTKTYIEQYTILTNTLDNVTPNIEQERWKKIKQSLRFNKSALLDSIRLMVEMGLLLKNLKIKKITEEQTYLIAAYNAILHGDKANKFSLRKHFSEKEIDSAVQTALVAKDQRRGKKIKSVGKVDCNTVVIHGVHQFTPTILSMIEEVSKYKRVVLLFNYQQQYSEIYQTWLDVYSCFDLNIKSQFNNEFKPTTLLQTSYEGNILADQIGKLTNGTLTEKSKDINNVSVIEFDNITEFSAYVAHIYEDAVEKYYADEQKKGSVLSYMREQFYSANSSVNDILKVYFPEQFGERHFLAYPIGHFFVAVTKMWNSENGGIKIEDMNDMLLNNDEKVKDVITQYYNIIQGNLKSSQVFIRATEFNTDVRKIQKAKLLIPGEQLMLNDPIPQRREIREIYEKIYTRIPKVAEAEINKANKLLEHFIIPDNRNAKVKWISKDGEVREISFTGQSDRKKKLTNYLIIRRDLNNDILLDYDVVKKIELISKYYGHTIPKHIQIIISHIENMEVYKELKKIKDEEDIEIVKGYYNKFLDDYFSDDNQRIILSKLLDALKSTFINS